MPLTIAALTIAMGFLKTDGLEPPRLFMGRLPSMILQFGHGHGLTDVGILLNPANPMNEPVVPAMKQTAQCERRTVRLRARFESSGRSWHTGFLHSLYARARLNGNLELSRRINIVRHSKTTT
jgi:hypothetical protein